LIGNNSFEFTVQQYLTPGWVSSSGCITATEPISRYRCTYCS